MDVQETTHLTLPRTGGGHALIIEDEELIASSIEEELREHGFTTFGVARSEREAILFADQQEPDLITVDAKLAEGSGVSAILKICTRRAVPVIVVTGYPLAVTLPGVVTLGKPFNSAAFTVALEHATARPFSTGEIQ